jgi:hypothetical protein
MRTKTEATILFVVLFVFVCQPTTMGIVGITSVDVIPNQPLETDIITFNISGGASSMPSWVEYDQFSQNGTSLRLDLYIDRGFFQMVSNWTYSRQISPLPPDVYNLQVRAFDYQFGTLDDTYNVDFAVVPEPGTLAIFAFALPIFRYRLRRKTKGLQINE